MNLIDNPGFEDSSTLVGPGYSHGRVLSPGYESSRDLLTSNGFSQSFNTCPGVLYSFAVTVKTIVKSIGTPKQKAANIDVGAGDAGYIRYEHSAVPNNTWMTIKEYFYSSPTETIPNDSYYIDGFGVGFFTDLASQSVSCSPQTQYPCCSVVSVVHAFCSVYAC